MLLEFMGADLGLSAEERASLRRLGEAMALRESSVWSLADPSGSGVVGEGGMAALLQYLGDFGLQQQQAILGAFDADGDGRLSAAEGAAAPRSPSPDRVRALRDRHGPRQAHRRGQMELFLVLPARESAADLDGDGVVSGADLPVPQAIQDERRVMAGRVKLDGQARSAGRALSETGSDWPRSIAGSGWAARSGLAPRRDRSHAPAKSNWRWTCAGRSAAAAAESLVLSRKSDGGDVWSSIGAGSSSGALTNAHGLGGKSGVPGSGRRRSPRNPEASSAATRAAGCPTMSRGPVTTQPRPRACAPVSAACASRAAWASGSGGGSGR